MVKFGEKSKGGRLSVTARLRGPEVTDEAGWRAFSDAALTGFMKIEKAGGRTVKFCGPAAVSLRERLANPITVKEIFALIRQITEAFERLLQAGLAPCMTVWDSRHVYYNEATRRLQFLYLPRLPSRSMGNIFSLLETVCCASVPQAVGDVKAVTGFLGFLGSLPAFDVLKIESYLSGEEEKPRPGAVSRDVFKTDKENTGVLIEERYSGADEGADMTETCLSGEGGQTSLLSREDGRPGLFTAEGGRHETSGGEGGRTKFLSGEDGGTELLTGKSGRNEFFGGEGRQTDFLSGKAGRTSLLSREDGRTGLFTGEGGRPEPLTGEGGRTGPSGGEDGQTELLGGDDERTVCLNETSEPAAKHLPSLSREKTGEIINIDVDFFRVGKDKEYVDYFVDGNRAVSRSHADIIIRDGHFYVRDLQSRNHTFINDVMLTPGQDTELFDEDRLRLADEEFVFHL